MRTVYQIRVEGPKRAFDSVGHFFSKRVFVSLDRAKAFAPEFEKICCGDGLLDLERVTDTKFVELELLDAPLEGLYELCALAFDTTREDAKKRLTGAAYGKKGPVAGLPTNIEWPDPDWSGP